MQFCSWTPNYLPKVLPSDFFLKEGKDVGFLDGLGVFLGYYDHRSEVIIS
jgi:hypothetical protein